jgi:ferrous iron transport protein A
MTLLELKEGETARITAITGGRGVQERMNALGIYTGIVLRMIKEAPFHGPILVEETGSGARMMIGRGMAGRLEVTDGQARR